MRSLHLLTAFVSFVSSIATMTKAVNKKNVKKIEPKHQNSMTRPKKQIKTKDAPNTKQIEPFDFILFFHKQKKTKGLSRFFKKDSS